VSRTLETPIWRNTTIIRDDVVAAVTALKAKPGKSIVLDGSSQLLHTLIEHDLVDELYLHVYPLAFGTGKRAFPATGIDRRYTLVTATPYPTGVVGLHYTR
jgi:dihydrofolate reductase